MHFELFFLPQEFGISDISNQFAFYALLFTPILILISNKYDHNPFSLSNAHNRIMGKVADCLTETVYHLSPCGKHLIAKSLGS